MRLLLLLLVLMRGWWRGRAADALHNAAEQSLRLRLRLTWRRDAQRLCNGYRADSIAPPAAAATTAYSTAVGEAVLSQRVLALAHCH
jgi:hypothetical protein